MLLLTGTTMQEEGFNSRTPCFHFADPELRTTEFARASPRSRKSTCHQTKISSWSDWNWRCQPPASGCEPSTFGFR